MYRISQKQDIWLYGDVLSTRGDLIFLEMGLSKNFDLGKIGGFINLSGVYDKATGKEIRIAFMVSL